MRNYRIVNNWDRIRRRTDRIMATRTRASCEILRAAIVRNISQGFTRTDGPSKPGEFPHRDSGALAQSYMSVVTKEGNQTVGYVGSALSYSIMLELGTSKMAPRPHIVPSWEQVRRIVQLILTAPIREDLST